MDTNLEESLENLKGISRSLNTVSDGMTHAITALEKRLQVLNLGIECWVSCDNIGAQGVGYLRLGSHWVIAYRQGERTVPLINATRIERCLGVQALPQLINELQLSATHIINQVEAATKVAQRVVSALSDVQSSAKDNP